MKNNSTVLIISGVFKPEPIVSASLMSDLASELSKYYKVVVLHPKPSRPLGFQMPEYNYSNLPYEVIQIDSYIYPKSDILGRFRESVSMGKACADYIEKHHEEICFIYNAPWQLFGRKIVAKKAVKYNIPYVTPVQDIFPESVTFNLPKIIRKVADNLLVPIDMYTLTNAAFIHTISDKMVEFFFTKRGIQREKFLVVRNWQNEEDFINYRNNHPEKTVSPYFTFMYLGNVGQLAGIEVLFEALRLSELSEARLVIAGSGSAKENLQALAKLKYSDCNIEFWNVPAGEVQATQEKADVMCLPIKTGGAEFSIPSKLPAYMFSEKPIIASVDLDCDTAVCIQDSDCGWVVEPESPTAIATAMRTAFYSDKKDLESKGENGFKFAINYLSRTSNLKKLSDACIKIINKNK